MELLLERQNDPSKQLLRKELGNKDDVRERAIFVGMPCGGFSLLFYSLAFFILLCWQHQCGELICIRLPHVCSIHLVFIKLAFHKHTLSLGHQTADMTTASAAAAAASASSGLHFSLTDGRSQLEAVFLSPLLPLPVRINSFRLTWRVSAHQSPRVYDVLNLH